MPATTTPATRERIRRALRLHGEFRCHFGTEDELRRIRHNISTVVRGVTPEFRAHDLRVSIHHGEVRAYVSAPTTSNVDRGSTLTRDYRTGERTRRNRTYRAPEAANSMTAAPRRARPATRHSGVGRRFGLEIEVVGISGHAAARVISEAGIEAEFEGYTHRVSSDWKVVRDASVSGCEVVSPPLTIDRWNEVETVLKALRDAGASVDRSTGLHVHVDCNDLTRVAVAKVVRHYAERQGAFDQLVARSRRNGRWCRSWGASELEVALTQLVRSGHPTADRYRTVNVLSYARYGTLEVRQHQGTLNARKLRAWVEVLVATFDAVKAGAPVRTDLYGMLSDLPTLTEVTRRFLWLRAAELAAA